MIEHLGPGVAGVDEAGRGPLAGPVLAAAVMLARPIAGLRDSKKLSPSRRAELAARIRAEAQAWAISSASTWEIERDNILGATLAAMDRALRALPLRPQRILVDGNRLLSHWQAEAMVGGDDRVDAIAAASILAKEARDREMRLLDQHYPLYEFGRHQAYGTAAHLLALRRFGVTSLHRRQFAPVAALLRKEG
ncbi:ribonuclease HII [Candidatus Igneacidithiobacillus taiwanensis]|uniref:ribonuclease HII n=1 Tax=Candidatus Igneacidithiobacillus taiwanensis TaxID=1945924 RepID=UPI0028982C75|nr:ribonuclease HII [Candidatus Igneacidithiobacillus taiwanensis]MCE5360655.1 ribonuclease HII [Acidithiobacillus sp.]